MPLETGWLFVSGDTTGAERAGFKDTSWQKVSLPHSWNRVGNTGETRSPATDAYRGVGWYRLHFKTPQGEPDSRYYLEFDGVGVVAEVWLNGRRLGRHDGAFTRFRFDATDALRGNGDNVLAVKADSTKPAPGTATADVIPLSGDFFVYGGIYRPVRMIVVRPVHVDLMDFGGPGISATTLSLTNGEARVAVSGRIANDGSAPRAVRVETRILDAGGKAVARSLSAPLRIGKTPGTFREVLRIANPHLWQGREDPYLYRTVVTVLAGDVPLDRVEQPLGLRTMRFDPAHGFFLNGRHLFLKGVGLHQDRPEKGWAISRADQAEDFDLIGDLGANAVRMAHYPHDGYSYDLADARGFVIWAEIPLVNQVSYHGVPPSDGLTLNARQQLIELIRQNINHPSIAVWSIANEINLVATKGGTPSRPAGLLRSLQALAKREDPSRATTLADCCEVASDHAKQRDDIAGITDTIGYNKYMGWYGGAFADMGRDLDAMHAKHPDVPIAVSEYGAGAALTQHSDNPEGGVLNPHGRPHPEEFQTAYHESSWPQLAARPYLWGAFIWNMFDFSSMQRQEGDQTDVNDKGLVSFDRNVRKDAFYYYRANWSALPTLHLAGRRYENRAYGVVDVVAFSNAAEARLFDNDHLIGNASCAGGICRWPEVHLTRGVNDLSAEAVVAGKPVKDRLRWTFNETAERMRIKAGALVGYGAGQERYGSDAFFVGGTARGIDPPDTSADKRTKVAAADPGLYDSYREGTFAYRLPLPDGTYTVTLGFVEPVADKAGARRFAVAANGETKLTLDVFAAAGGRRTAVERSFAVQVRGGQLELAFRPLAGQALVSTIAVAPADQAP